MFERHSFEPETVAVNVIIQTGDNTRMTGRILAPRTRGLAEVMNGPSLFVDFETTDGDRLLLAKSAIKSVRSLHATRPADLQERVKDAAGFDPRSILGVSPTASRAEVRQAYLTLAKTYHPDRYASTELPAEVRDYLSAMTRRINAAYAFLQPQVTERPAAAQRAEAAYTASAAP
jgi:hypothetical protein